jgi:hypothetical protein
LFTVLRGIEGASTHVSATVTSSLGQFDRAQHRYTWNGAPLISVTQAIKGAGLIDCRWFTDEARERGRLVHMAVQFDAECDLDESSVDPSIWPYVEAARKFRTETGYVAESNEQQIWAPEAGYAGTLDGHGRIKIQKIIVDYKSGTVQPWVALQLCAYANKIEGGGGCLRWGVELKADGTYKITAFQPKDYRRDLSDFLSCVRVCQIQQERGLLTI